MTYYDPNLGFNIPINLNLNLPNMSFPTPAEIANKKAQAALESTQWKNKGGYCYPNPSSAVPNSYYYGQKEICIDPNSAQAKQMMSQDIKNKSEAAKEKFLLEKTKYWQNNGGVCYGYTPKYTLQHKLMPYQYMIKTPNSLTSQVCDDPSSEASVRILENRRLNEERIRKAAAEKTKKDTELKAKAVNFYNSLPLERKRYFYTPGKNNQVYRNGNDFVFHTSAPPPKIISPAENDFLLEMFQLPKDTPLPNIDKAPAVFNSILTYSNRNAGTVYTNPLPSQYNYGNAKTPDQEIFDQKIFMYWISYLFLQGYATKSDKGSEMTLFGNLLKIPKGFPGMMLQHLNYHSSKRITAKAKEYLDALKEVVMWIRDNDEIPGEVKLPTGISDAELDNLKLFKREIIETSPKTVIIEEVIETPVDISDNSEKFVEELMQIPQDEYLRTRKEELEAVKANQKSLENKDPDEAIQDLEKAKVELENTKKEEDKKLVETKKELDAAKAKLEATEAKAKNLIGAKAEVKAVNAELGYIENVRNKSLSDYANLSGHVGHYTDHNLGGFLSKIKKQIKRIRKSVSRGFSSVAEETKRSIKKVVPKRIYKEASRFGKRVEDEIQRVEKRVRKETFRFSKKVMKVAPFLKFVAPFLGFIPVIGTLLAVFLIVGLAAVEINYAHKMGSLLKKQARASVRLMRAEIARIQEVTKKLEALIVRLEAARKRLAELAQLEAKRRREITASVFDTEEAKSKRIFLAAGLGAATLVPLAFKKRGWLSYLYMAGVGAGAIYALQDRREVPESIRVFQECTEVSPEEVCRSQYMEYELKRSLPELREIPALQKEVNDVMRQIAG